MTFSRVVASGFCSGFFPVAPGTAGSVVGAIIGAGLLYLSPWALFAGAIVASIGGLFATRGATGLPIRAAGKIHTDDPGWVVIDEIAGQFCALLFLSRPSWAGVALAFALFRFFDIIKPGPVGWADRQGGAFGVMFDDVLAGIAAGVLVGAVHFYVPRYV